MKVVILGLRFLLEVATVVGIFYGGIIQKEIWQKLFLIVLAVVIVIVWNFLGAPKSPTALVGIQKLLLELLLYGIGIAGFYYLYGGNMAHIYAFLVVFDLVMMYVLNLQGN